MTIAKLIKDMAVSVNAGPDEDQGGGSFYCQYCKQTMNFYDGFDPTAVCDGCAQMFAENAPEISEALKGAKCT